MATQGDEAKPANNRPILTPFPVPDQLFASYDDSAVRRALWDPEEYSKWREQKLNDNLKAQERFLSTHGYIPDSFLELENWLKTKTPDGPAYPESEPSGLDHFTYYQIEALKFTLNTCTWLTPGMRTNYYAVLDAYRSRKMTADPKVITYWYKGVQVPDAGPAGSEKRYQEVAKLQEKYGDGSLHVEIVAWPQLQLQS
ncbi:hypothetical protein DTO271D3_1844 [Paecilomyces variotii]|nr:hypothetical protein DTO271D3_1844 [Paecilomyces variotii]